MRAILISREGIAEIELPESNGTGPAEFEQLTAMQEAIGCRILTGAGYPDKVHAAWVDDEGLFDLGHGSMLTLAGWHGEERLAGNILVTGFDSSTGETTGATISAEDLLGMVQVGVLINRNRVDH